MKYVNKMSVVPFLLGMGATLLGAKAVKSQMVHRAAVNTVAKALVIRDEAARAASRVKEEAEDIYEEAKVQKNRESAEKLAKSCCCEASAAETVEA